MSSSTRILLEAGNIEIELSYWLPDIRMKQRDSPKALKRYLAALDKNVVFALIHWAHAEKEEELLSAACRRIANEIKGKTTEEIRAAFGIVNDFTPEEEEEAHRRAAELLLK